jgi:hypothetical protein
MDGHRPQLLRGQPLRSAEIILLCMRLRYPLSYLNLEVRWPAPYGRPLDHRTLGAPVRSDPEHGFGLKCEIPASTERSFVSLAPERNDIELCRQVWCVELHVEKH